MKKAFGLICSLLVLVSCSENKIVENDNLIHNNEVKINEKIVENSKVENEKWQKIIETKKFDCGITKINDIDGNVYNTVAVGTQCWLGKNINTGIMLTSGKFPSDNKVIEKYCYNNDEKNCLTDGGLYNLGEATEYDFYTEGVRGICPSGWHIPTDEEWHFLEDYLKDPSQSCDPTRVIFMTKDERRNITDFDCSGAGTQMKIGGNSGLNIPIAGFAYENNSLLLCEGTCPPSTEMNFSHRLESTLLWTSSQIGSRALWNDGNKRVTDLMVQRDVDTKNGAHSIRCIKD